MLIPRRFKNNLLRIIILVALALLGYHFFLFNEVRLGESLFVFKDTIKIPTANDVDVNSANYNDLFTRIQIDRYLSLLHSQKCDLYFKNALKNNPEFHLALKNHDYYRDFYKTFDEFKEKKKNDYDENDIETVYRNAWKNIRKDEQETHDYISYLRIFNLCYVKHDSRSKIEKLITPRLFPWLTFRYPQIRDYNGRRLKITHNDPGQNFFRNYKLNLQERGIVMTISDAHVEDTLKLLKLLKYFKNKLPIQIIFFKNLSTESQERIIDEARSGNFKQDVFFMDVTNAITPQYLHKFEGFGNKILATMFNTFKEMILIDADAVLLKPPQYFFGLEKYNINGTVFFKDRKAVEYRPKNDIIFFKKLLPSKFDTLAFDIPQPSNYSLQNDFFKGYNHYMESGLVVINRERHFFEPYLMSQLNFFYPVNTRVYGDKELFWLSFLMNGNENYSFNKHFSASIGELTPMNERFNDIGKAKSLKSQELCSNHPAHINDEDNHSLLWFNSGFKFCGQEANLEEEFKSKKRYTKYKTLKDFTTFMNDKLVITHAVIPPSDTITVDNTDGESNRAWLNMRQYCNGYTWCAYSSIGEEPDEKLTGFVVEYSPEEVAEFKRLGELWIGAAAVKLKKEPKDKIQLLDHSVSEVQLNPGVKDLGWY